MTHLREHWEGVSLSGNYTLEQWLGGDDNAAFFQTSLSPDGRRAVVKLVPGASVDGAAQLDLWHRIRQLCHPNLIALLDCGRADHESETVLYAVYEFPDDTLGSALSRAPLDQLESREVLDSVLDALRYLHAQGLVLGVLDPDHIVAVGDRIKLAIDDLREAGPASSYREDVRLLGELWQQALMPASPKSPEIAAHAADPDPNARWTLAEISAALDPPLPTVPPPAPAPPVSVPIAERAVSASPVFSSAADAGNTAPSLPTSHAEPVAAKPFPKWILAGLAGVLLLIAGLNWPRSARIGTESRAAPVPLPAESPVSTPIPKSTAPKPTVPAAPRASPAAGKEVWRVIAFTYRTREAAAKKVQQLNEHHPGLNAAIFSPAEKRGYYLVSLGGRMTHDEALRLKRTARGKGLPRDLFVQNYSR